MTDKWSTIPAVDRLNGLPHAKTSRPSWQSNQSNWSQVHRHPFKSSRSLKWSNKLSWVNFWPKDFLRNYRFTPKDATNAEKQIDVMLQSQRLSPYFNSACFWWIKKMEGSVSWSISERLILLLSLSSFSYRRSRS